MADTRTCYMEAILAPHYLGYSNSLQFNKNKQFLLGVSV